MISAALVHTTADPLKQGPSLATYIDVDVEALSEQYVDCVRKSPATRRVLCDLDAWAEDFQQSAVHTRHTLAAAQLPTAALGLSGPGLNRL